MSISGILLTNFHHAQFSFEKLEGKTRRIFYTQVVKLIVKIIGRYFAVKDLPNKIISQGFLFNHSMPGYIQLLNVQRGKFFF